MEGNGAVGWQRHRRCRRLRTKTEKRLAERAGSRSVGEAAAVGDSRREVINARRRCMEEEEGGGVMNETGSGALSTDGGSKGRTTIGAHLAVGLVLHRLIPRRPIASAHMLARPPALSCLTSLLTYLITTV